ncbi:unnamed protein product [Mycena citricolor]|uniref:Uncharacterized protein n=1 Tax=Mycena citricolor TaxID=2018698 RepID=A0AAD2H7H6_9AGAR|nr:unnamed protein product [Mycena citricolor]CAK5270225.1 unnamed protein product [Mycena citricolor]
MDAFSRPLFLDGAVLFKPVRTYLTSSRICPHLRDDHLLLRQLHFETVKWCHSALTMAYFRPVLRLLSNWRCSLHVTPLCSAGKCRIQTSVVRSPAHRPLLITATGLVSACTCGAFSSSPWVTSLTDSRRGSGVF